MSNLRNLQDFYFKEAKRLNYVARSALKLVEINQKHKVIPAGGTVLDLGCSPGAWLQVACQALGAPARGGAVLGLDLKEPSRPPTHCDERVRMIQGDARGMTRETLLAWHPKGFTTVLSDMCPNTMGAAGADALRSLALAEVALDIAIGDSDDEDSTDDDAADEDGTSDARARGRAASAAVGAAAEAAAGAAAALGAPAVGTLVGRPAAGAAVGAAAGPDAARTGAAAAAAGAAMAAAMAAGRGVLRPRGSLVVKLLEGEGQGRRLLAERCRGVFEKVLWMRPKATRPESKEVYLVALRRRGQHAVL